MKSKVYFSNLRATYKENLFDKIEKLLNIAGISDAISKRDLVAVKIHFGEMGNIAYVRPVYLRKIVEIIKSKGGIPFLTDANTLYAGTRSDAPHHIITAIQNGFAHSVIEAPIIIADGLRGKSETTVVVNQKHFKEVYIGSEIVQADSLISVAHFKCHELSGFGGTLKNLGMGCASRRGKMAQHSKMAPGIKKKKCIGCGDCTSHCSQQAISLFNDKAVIDSAKCIGCGECILICINEAIQIRWDAAIPVFLEKMVEYTMGVLKNKTGKALFINFITDISPNCDCVPYNDAPIVKDIGIVVSNDPVALDQASVDLVNNEQALPGTCINPALGPGEDKFRAVHPKVDWPIQLDYAQKLGLGSRSYKIIEV